MSSSANVQNRSRSAAARGGAPEENEEEVAAEIERKEKESWSLFRQKLDLIFQSSKFDMALGVVIVLNIFAIIAETDNSAACVLVDDPKCGHSDFLTHCNYVFLAIYTVEAGLRIYTYRFPKLFHDFGAMFDFLIVFLGYFDLVLSFVAAGIDLPGFQVLRIFRVARLARAIRILRGIPELYAMVRGFRSAMSAMFWGFLIIMILIMMWAILAVETINEFNQEDVLHETQWCYDAFGSVAWTMLLFFQTLVAGDSWGTCAVPVIQMKEWSFFIFAGAHMTIQLGFTNLILAVIVEKAAQVRQEDQNLVEEEREKERREAALLVYDYCKTVDENQTNSVSLEELMKAYDTEGPLRHALSNLDIDKADLKTLFSYMDTDKKGQLSYEDFVQCISRANNSDLRNQLMIVKLQLEELTSTLQSQVQHSMQGMADQMIQRMEAMNGISVPKNALEAVPEPSNGRESLDVEFSRFRHKLNQEITLVMHRVSSALAADPIATVNMHHPPSLKPGGTTTAYGQFTSHYWMNKPSNGSGNNEGPSVTDDEWDRPEVTWENSGQPPHVAHGPVPGLETQPGPRLTSAFEGRNNSDSVKESSVPASPATMPQGVQSPKLINPSNEPQSKDQPPLS